MSARCLAESGLDWTVHAQCRRGQSCRSRKIRRRFDGDEFGRCRPAPLVAAARNDALGPQTRRSPHGAGPLAGRLLAWIGDEATSPVLVRRLAEVQGQQNLMTTYSDQYWAYRASLRDQVKEKPRSQIQQVSADDEQKQMHPEDRRRLQYFATLGRAVKSHQAADIERLPGLRLRTIR